MSSIHSRSQSAARWVLVLLALVMALPFAAPTPDYGKTSFARTQTSLFDYHFDADIIVPRAERETRSRDKSGATDTTPSINLFALLAVWLATQPPRETSARFVVPPIADGQPWPRRDRSAVLSPRAPPQLV
jgi:hypothetical protein